MYLFVLQLSTSKYGQNECQLFANSNDDNQIATGRQAGGAAVATGVLALATIAMITEFIVYSGFTPKVKYHFIIKMWITIVLNN